MAVNKHRKKQFEAGFKVLVSIIKRYKREVVVLSVLGIVSALGNGIVPYIAGSLIDAIISPEEVVIVGRVLQLSVVTLLVWSIVQLITYIVDWQIGIRSDRLGARAYIDYLIEGYTHLLELPIEFHKKHKIGEIGNKISMAANHLNGLVGRVVIGLAPEFLSIIIALIVTLLIHPLLTLILLGGMLSYIIILSKSVTPLSGLYRKMHEQWNRSYGDVWDAIMNVKEIKQATTEDYEKSKMHTAFRTKLSKTWFRIDEIWQDLGLYQKISILATQAVIYGISIYLVLNRTLTVGELVAFNGYAAMLFGPFVTLGREWQNVQNAFIDLEKTQKIFNRSGEVYVPDHAHTEPLSGKVEFRNVDFYYDKDKPVIEDISFTVEPGEVVALVGESGVGKSTLIDLISGYYFARRGNVLIDGVDVREYDLKHLRRHISVVPQDVVLFNDSILKNITYGSFGVTKEQVKEAVRKAHALEFIERFPKKWKQVVGERGVKLSGGQKQRIAIARAILQDPTILILDEPTSALDAKAEKVISESLDELMKGRTTFIIAHRLSTVRKADKILVIKDGKIVEQGRHEELLTIENGIYKHLYDLQIGLHT